MSTFNFVSICLVVCLSRPMAGAPPATKTTIPVQQSAFSTSDYLLLQGKFLAWFAANAIAQLGPNDRRLKISVMFLSSVMVPLSEQINWQALQSIWGWISQNSKQNNEFWEQVVVVQSKDVEPYRNFIFNPTTQKELDAVIYRALMHAATHEKQSTILLYGEPGTGKTGVGESLSHWSQFKVHRIPSRLLANAANFRIVSKLCHAGFQSDNAKQINVILVDDAEFFFRALTPGTSNYHSTTQEELESEFRTSLGGDSPHCLWFFTSNKVADLEGDLHGALRRRFKNQIWIRRPDEKTFVRMLRKFTEDAISGRNIQIEENALSDFTTKDLQKHAETISPDALRQIAENAVQLAINEANDSLNTVYIKAEHWGFFMTARTQSEDWMIQMAEKEFREKRQKLERMVLIKSLEKQLESNRTGN